MKHVNHCPTVVRALRAGGSLAFLLATLLLCVTVRGFAEGGRYTKQLKFSHKKHAENGVACTDCHTDVTASRLATDPLLPKMTVCATCHEDQTKNDCTYCHIGKDTTAYHPFRQARFDLLFPHASHVGEQKVACETCHAGLDKDETGELRHLPGMATCNTCHNDVKAPNNCERCHTNFAALRPESHNRNDFVREHKFQARLDDAKCARCHTQESCIDCHNGVGLVKVDVQGTDMMSAHSPRLTENDRGQQQQLTKVHDLNFRFTHGITAAGRIDECRTCHDEQVFCSTCHENGGNVDQVKFKPASHQQPGFVTLPGGDGGMHARLARRDIEQCAACHDAYDPDPTCMLCHKRAN